MSDISAKGSKSITEKKGKSKVIVITNLMFCLMFVFLTDFDSS